MELAWRIGERSGETDGRRTLDNEDFFARLGQRASALLGETPAEGFGYRVAEALVAHLAQ